MQFDPSTSDGWRSTYKLLTGAIVPRAIAFVSTVSPDGSLNLAPFSFFTAACANPPTVLFCPMFRGDEADKKDTLRNIEATREFVVNVVTETIAEQMNVCATEFPFGVNEFEEAGLTPAPSQRVKPPRVSESPINMECTLNQIVTISDRPGGGSIVIGEVVAFHVADELVDDFRIDVAKLAPIGRLAGPTYARVREFFEMERLPYQAAR